MRRRKRPEGVPPHKAVLYTIYLAKTDEIVCFEEPADRAGAILGLSADAFYEKVSREKSPKCKYKKHKYIIEKTVIAEMPLEDQDEQW